MSAGSPKPRRILCVDDDANLGRMLASAIERSGYRVECLEDGELALARITTDEQGFDLVLTDHQMPRLSGLGLVAKLRATPFAGFIVVHSSALSEEEVTAYKALGVDQILSKPVELAVLLAVIRRYLETER